MKCLDENQVLQYVGGFLSAEDRLAVEEHVARCDECRWMLSAAGAAVLDEYPTGDATEPRDARDVPDELAVARRLHEVLQGTYVIERFIGLGGIGVVYEASHRRLPRRFAVKLLFGQWASDPIAVARLEREAEVTSRLSHPNIVDVVDFNHADDGTPFIVMELLEGESLQQWLAHRGPVSDPEQIARIARPVTSALGAAHAKGIVHRDLKPSNIFLCPDDHGGVAVKVVDFGIAKVVALQAQPGGGLSRELTRVHAVMGTPSYMSPEQAMGRSAAVDHRADIFSLGAILFRMVSGESPFQGASVDERLEAVTRKPPAKNARWHGAPGGLRRAILTALSKDPARRQQSMAQLWEELARALGQVDTTIDLTGETHTETVWPRREPSGQLPRALARPRSRWRGPLLAAGAASIAILVAVVALWPDPLIDRRRSRARLAAADLSLDAGRDAHAAPVGRAVSLASGVDAADGAAVGGSDAMRLTASSGRSDAGVSAPARRRRSRSRAVRPARSAGHRRLRRTKPPPKKEQRKIDGWGTLVVQSKEAGHYCWADVYLDQRRVGKTPLTLDKVRQGRHRVQVRRPGYRAASREVLVEPGGRATVRFELQRQ